MSSGRVPHLQIFNLRQKLVPRNFFSTNTTFSGSRIERGQNEISPAIISDSHNFRSRRYLRLSRDLTLSAFKFHADRCYFGLRSKVFLINRNHVLKVSLHPRSTIWHRNVDDMNIPGSLREKSLAKNLWTVATVNSADDKTRRCTSYPVTLI